MTTQKTSDRSNSLHVLTSETAWPGWVLLSITGPDGEPWYRGIVPERQVVEEAALVGARRARVLAEEAIRAT